MLNIKPRKGDDDYNTELRVLLQGIVTTVNTQLKVDENALRRLAADQMPKILEAIERVERGLPKIAKAG